ncbi:MAG: DMT family transporter [Bacteroidales bacterium]
MESTTFAGNLISVVAMSNRTKGILFALTTAFLWGFLPIALKVVTGFIDPLTIGWFRFLVAFFLLFVILGIRKPKYLKILTNPPLYIIIASLGLGINYLGFIYGLKLTTPGTAQVFIQAGPMVLGLVGFIFFRETLSKRQGFGFLVAGLGLLFFYRENLAQMVAQEDMFSMGVVWVLIAAMAWAVYATFQKKLVQDYPPQQLNLFLFGLPVILFLPFVRFSEFIDLTFLQWMLMLFLGLNTLIAYGSLSMAFKYIEASKVSIIVTMNPVLTFVYMGLLALWEVSWIVPEKLSIAGMAAAVMVLIGAVMAIVASHPSKKKTLDQFFKRKASGKTNP